MINNFAGINLIDGMLGYRSLAIKVSNCKYRGLLDRCTVRGEIFNGCNPQFLNTMIMKLKLVFFMPNEEIFKKDDLARELALVHHGACFIYDDEKVSRVVRHDVSSPLRVTPRTRCTSRFQPHVSFQQPQFPESEHCPACWLGAADRYRTLRQ